MNVYLLWKTVYGMQDLEGVYLSKDVAKCAARALAAQVYTELNEADGGLPPPHEVEQLQIYFSGHFRRCIFEIRLSAENVITVGEHPVKDSALEALASAAEEQAHDDDALDRRNVAAGSCNY